ncbi:hypothetical protein Lste_3424 [Legionella steelei]|uniref:Coiled-coil protein n=2 Tax=Legionellaceae TaxID=444 RepID=A0A0W0ZDI5_9GAMM|nr:hypothetical protein Lste_3424 [Legionella steelei]OJW09490.1 MAG: hypothetical protein BGO44_04220 [Legionella sp. 39-23]
MPLPPRKAVMNRFALLDRIYNVGALDAHFQSLIAPPTPPVLHDYFTLLREGNKDKFKGFLDKYGKEEPLMAKVCQAHFLINTEADSPLILSLIDELKQAHLGIGYRFEAEVSKDENKKLQDLQAAHELGDEWAAGLIGNKYLNYLHENLVNNKYYNFPRLGINPARELKLAGERGDPQAIQQSLSFLENVPQMIKDLNPVNAAKTSGYELSLLPDDAAREKNKIYLKITDDDLTYELLDQQGQLQTAKIPWTDLNFRMRNNLFQAQKDILLPLVLKVVADKGHVSFDQSFFDDKLNSVLKGAKELATDDEELSMHLEQARDALGRKDYVELTKLGEQMHGYINATYKEKQNNKMNEALVQARSWSLPVGVYLRKDLNILFDHYQEETSRIRNGNAGKVSKIDEINIESLQRAQKDLLRINEEPDDEKMHELLNSHIQSTDTEISKLPHPNAFVRGLEALINKIRSNSSEEGRFSFNHKQKFDFMNRFATIKQKLEVLKQADQPEPKNDPSDRKGLGLN